MKHLIIILLLSLNLTGCGDDVQNITTVQNVVDSQAFEGQFNLPYGGFVEVLESGDNSVAILSLGQRVILKNPKNDSLGTFPRFNSEKIAVIGDSFIIAKDFNFTSNNDIEQDISGVNITGVHYAIITGTMVDGRLRLNFKVYSGKLSDNVNFLIVNRTIVSLKL